MAKKTMNCDLCVIGAGGCGLVAGVEAMASVVPSPSATAPASALRII